VNCDPVVVFGYRFLAEPQARKQSASACWPP
jgi:hypothetical protein